MKTLTGESVYTPEELKTAMVSLKSKIESNEQLLDEPKEEEAGLVLCAAVGKRGRIVRVSEYRKRLDSILSY